MYDNLRTQYALKDLLLFKLLIYKHKLLIFVSKCRRNLTPILVHARGSNSLKTLHASLWDID